MAVQIHLNKLKEGVAAWNKWRKEYPHILPDLRNVRLHGETLSEIDFSHTNLDNADLSHANLRLASLKAASLCQANLSGTKFRSANLCKATFKGTILQQANFYQAALLDTAFLNVDLSQAINLETAVHLGPSTIGIDTIQRSRGKIADIFLMRAGVSEQLLAGFHSLGKAPFDYYTCFISVRLVSPKHAQAWGWAGKEYFFHN